MEKYKIDYGLPIPPIEHGLRPKEPKYPWNEMRIGGSIFFPHGSHEYRAAPAAAYQYGKKHGMTFTRRKVPGGVRVYREA